MSTIWEEFRKYQTNHDVTRIRKRDIPAHLQDAVKTYLSALTEQLADPDNESVDSLGPNERHNALLAVRLKFSAPTTLEVKGSCPRCGGTGYILAYGHVRGGRCLACNDSGNAWPNPHTS